MLNRDDGHLLNKTDDDVANPHYGPGPSFYEKCQKHIIDFLFHGKSCALVTLQVLKDR